MSLRSLSLVLAALVAVLAATSGAAAWWVEHRREIVTRAEAATGGQVAHAEAVMITHGCAGCHTIPGVAGASGKVGPTLDGSLATRVTLGGGLPNTPANLIRWIRFAREIDPNTAMPSTGVSEQEARDVAAYLYTLR